MAVEVPEGAEITTAPSQLTFTTETWNTEQTVTVTAIQDADAVADLPVTLAHEVSGGDYQGLAAAGVEVTIAEDDVPGVKVSETALTLAEGDAGTYTVVLDTEPAAEVTVAVEVPSGTDLTVTPSELRFTAADWNTAQTVTVTAIQDADAVADLPVTLAHEVSGGDYQGLAAAGVEVTIAEDDVPGVKVSETALTLAEGDAGTYTVVLDTEPAAEVTVAVEVPSGTDLTVTPSELRFTATDWHTAQTVTVTAIQDADAVADLPVTLAHEVSGGDYQGLAAAGVEVTIAEDDVPGVKVSEPALTVVEGDAATYTVVLDTEPAAEVTVAVEVPAGAEITAAPSQLTFTTETWNTEQTVTVTAIQDADAIADDPVTLAHTVRGGDYEGLAAAGVEVTITEGDLPVLTIADAEAPESAGQILFTVTLSLASSRTVTVDCRTADGTARAHEDYTAAANLLTFAPGRTEAQIAVPVANDGLREGNETFTVVLSNPAYATMARGAATGTIVDDDASVDEAWLARFGRTAAGQVIEALDERLRRLQRGAHLTIGGQRLQLGEAPEPGSRPPHRNIHPVAPSFLSSDLPGPLRAPRTARGPLQTGRDLTGVSSFDILTRSSFFLSSGPAPGETGARWTFWRRWAKSHFRGEDTGMSLDGGPWTGLLGVDREQGRALAGLALSYTIGDGGYHVHTAEEALARGNAESWLINAHPYLRVALNERVSAWGLVGHGRGQMSLGAGRERSGIAMTLGGLGLRGALLPPGRLGLTLRSDAFLVRMRSAAAEPAVSRVRMAMEGTRAVLADSGRTWTPSLELGVRHDGGDAETGLGMEMGGGLGYRDPGRGLTVKTTVRRLLIHQDSGYEEWGVGGSFGFSTGASGRGLALRLRSSYGDAASGVDRFWSQHRTTPQAGSYPAGRGGLFNAEVGYGLGALGGLLTPYADMASGRGTRTYGLGGRLRLEPSLSLELAGGRRETTAAPPGHELRLRGTLHW